MLSKIIICAQDEMKKTAVRIESATVVGINSDGTVDITLPAQDGAKFTRIQNQTPFELEKGDVVELLLKKGSYNNCWIIAKHGMNNRIESGESGTVIKQYGGSSTGTTRHNQLLGLDYASSGHTGFVAYVSQDLTEEQKRIARENIGAATTSSEDGTVRYDVDQSLSEEEKARARANIGAGNGGGTITDITVEGPIVKTGTSGTVILSHADSGVTAGTYTSMTVNAKGHITAGTNPTTLAGYGISDARINNGVIILGSQTLTPYTASNPPAYPVTAVNNRTGDVHLTASDVGAMPIDTVIPTKLSELQNDVGYLTSAPVTSVNGQTGAVTISVPTKTSQLTNDSGYLTNAPVTSVNGSVGDVVIEIPSKTSQLDNDAGFVTNANIPTKTSQLTNDSGFLTSAPVTSVNTKTGDVVLAKADVGLGNVDNVKQYSAQNLPPLHSSTYLQTGDLNTYYGETKVGWYHAPGGNTCTNKPSGVDAFGLIVTRIAVGWYLQTIVSSNTSTGNTYNRIWASSSWTEWKRVAFATDIPTVNDATLTIKQGNTVKGTFSANASEDVTITLSSGGGTGGADPNDGKLTIQNNGETVGTFTADQADDVTIDIKTLKINVDSEGALNFTI